MRIPVAGRNWRTSAGQPRAIGRTTFHSDELYYPACGCASSTKGATVAIERREFLKTTGKAITVGAATLALGGEVLGANDRVRVAVCGVRGRGNDHLHGFARVPGTEIAALCDVDENVLNQRLGDVEKRGLPKPKSYVDVRKLLEDKDIDAISIATPNHWHSLMAIWACQAGKDVYVEKPCSHNWFEGRQLVRAVKKYNRICQHGSQSRSNPGMLEAIQHLTDGTIGDVYMASAICYKWRPSIGHAAEEPVPAGVHYDLWTGPATLKSAIRPSTKSILHGGVCALASRCPCPPWADTLCSRTTRRHPIP